MHIFLSFIGNNDCHLPEKDGAIISILKQIKFNKVYLLYNHERYLKHGNDIIQYCKVNFPHLLIELQESIAHDPIDYNLVYPAMHQAVNKIIKSNKNAEYTISLTSGTSTMHACWIFLCQGGVVPAKLIQTSKETGISEVSFNLDDFPKIQHVNAVKLKMTRLSRENKMLKNQSGLNYDPIVGNCPEILKVKHQIQIFSNGDIPVFISGESGTGKELVADAIHYNSSRKEKPLIKVNCGSIPPQLFESEFFGHKKGAFTGAINNREGKFTLANNGTIFLDEIADLSLDMQVKLLRVLENKTFVPVGDDKELKVNIRIISATNKDIRKMVHKNEFREDLFYRLVNAIIMLPPLRERRNDKVMIAKYILKQLNIKNNKRKVLNKSAIDLILKYFWPGNIRQLKIALETTFLYPTNDITAECMNIIEFFPIANEIILPKDGVDLNGVILPLYYEAALKRTDGNAEQAAKLLSLTPHTFRARLKKNEK